MEPILFARWEEQFNAQSMFSRNADCISATQFYMSALVVMSVLNAELVFPVCGNICSHFFLIYQINPEYIWFHQPCTACTIVLNWNFIPNSAELYLLGCHRPQSLPAGCTASAVWVRSQTPLGACHKWSSLGICGESAAVSCMPSWALWFWHPHSHVAVASIFLV